MSAFLPSKFHPVHLPCSICLTKNKKNQTKNKGRERAMHTQESFTWFSGLPSLLIQHFQIFKSISYVLCLNFSTEHWASWKKTGKPRMKGPFPLPSPSSRCLNSQACSPQLNLDQVIIKKRLRSPLPDGHYYIFFLNTILCRRKIFCKIHYYSIKVSNRGIYIMNCNYSHYIYLVKNEPIVCSETYYVHVFVQNR